MFAYILELPESWKIAILFGDFALLGVIGWSFNEDEKKLMFHLLYSIMAGFTFGIVLTLSPSFDMSRGAIFGWSSLAALVAKPLFKSILETAGAVIPKITESVGKMFANRFGNGKVNKKESP